MAYIITSYKDGRITPIRFNTQNIDRALGELEYLLKSSRDGNYDKIVISIDEDWPIKTSEIKEEK